MNKLYIDHSLSSANLSPGESTNTFAALGILLPSSQRAILFFSNKILKKLSALITICLTGDHNMPPKLLIPKRVAIQECYRIQGGRKVVVYRVGLSERVVSHLTSAKVILRRTLITSICNVNKKINLIYYSKCATCKKLSNK